jgi:hypothetical protein
MAQGFELTIPPEEKLALEDAGGHNVRTGLDLNLDLRRKRARSQDGDCDHGQEI